MWVCIGFIKTANPLSTNTGHDRENERQWGVLVAQSPSAGRWLTRLGKNQATEQLTDIGTGFFKLDYQKAHITR